MGLFCETIELDRCNPAVNNVALGVMTNEHVYDPDVLRRLMTERLQRSGVSTLIGSSVTDISRNGTDGFELFVEPGGRACFDAIVNCSYAEINRLTTRLGHRIEARLYEYTAAAIVELDLPAQASITVLDGPFMTLLPFGMTGHHLIYHAEHSVIAQAREPLLDPAWLDPDASPFASVNQERWFSALIKSCCEFVPALRGARLKRILQGPRMVLADREDTDARPSIVTAHERGYITTLSGKVDHCVWVADEVAKKLGCVPEIA
jgi:glycine/D-amino acid oxidase-like deaminating enzyme